MPKDRIKTGAGPKSFDDGAQGIVGAVNWFLSDRGRAAEVLGARQGALRLRQ